MLSFHKSFPDIANSSGAQDWLTSILPRRLVFSRKHTIFGGSIWVTLGSYLTAGARSTGFLYAGHVFTGLGVGTLSATG
ncbi:general substrate transporter [Penicillium riverlandense]|uniref:general substrate transporter n=1 Tax=Penicillium riverlandense TaxID=1903569 RepID=UPI0025478E39|nr:general substrate transporter [Penicillium riverlandense]KAJ5819758.1 general substrate transporter [Penicillium riverlandense]